jgi:excisionase family DNA binding protein
MSDAGGPGAKCSAASTGGSTTRRYDGLNHDHVGSITGTFAGRGRIGQQMIGDRQTVSIVEACRQVGVSRRTIYNWMAGGKVEYVRTAGGAVRIFSDTLWRHPGDPGPVRRPGSRGVASE